MKEINISDIDNYCLNDLSVYYFSTTSLAKELANKKIKEICVPDLLYLVKEQYYIDLVALIAIRKFEIEGFSGNNLRKRKALLRQLLILDKEFYKYNQTSFLKLKTIIEQNPTFLDLTKKNVRQFVEFKLQAIIWGDNEIDIIKDLIEWDTLSTMHMARERIKQLKRAVDEGIEVVFNWKGNSFNIVNSDDIKLHIIKLLPDETNFEECMGKEVKINR